MRGEWRAATGSQEQGDMNQQSAADQTKTTPTPARGKDRLDRRRKILFFFSRADHDRTSRSSSKLNSVVVWRCLGVWG